MSAISPQHVDLLMAAGIAIDVAEAHGVHTVNTVDDLPEPLRWCRTAPGLMFPWRSPTGAVLDQYRPDAPVAAEDGRPRKYLFPADSLPVLNVHPSMLDRLAGTGPLVVVEGTKQYLAAVTAAQPTELAVVGLAGCWGWSHEQAPIPDLAHVTWTDRAVVVIFDADIATNQNVHEAARRLGDDLELRGASSVSFVNLPGSGSDGLDDVLASRAVDGSTTATFVRLIAKAKKLGKRPPPKRSPHFGPEGLLVAKLVGEVRSRLELAVDPGERLLAYVDGVYIDGRHTVTSALGDLLGDSYRPLHARAVVELLTARLVADGRVLDDARGTAVVNVANGLLDPFTGELRPHTPEHLSMVRFPVKWNPAATCPTFDAWLDEVTNGRGDDLLEATSQVLDQRGHRQRKAVFLHGPTRSAKSTFLRQVEQLVGPGARSAVTLHDLAGNRFAAADLFGKVLNTANELSSAHVDDLAIFKTLTGDDPVRAERKYGQPFTFRNRALFMFAANEIPTVSEVSGAYLARIRPYHFPHSYEGRENPGLERIMLGELEGVLVRLVEALRRFDTRGGYDDNTSSRAALDDFARHSDRVRLFLHETTSADPDGFVERGDLFSAFETWAQQNRRQVLGRHRFYDHVATAGYREVKRRGTRGFVGLDLRKESEWGAPGPDDDLEGAEGGQKGQNIHTPASRGKEEKGEEERVVRGGWAEPAPSAPQPGDELEVTTW
jgi:putative DNA primase/helicase